MSEREWKMRFFFFFVMKGPEPKKEEDFTDTKQEIETPRESACNKMLRKARGNEMFDRDEIKLKVMKYLN